MMSTETGQERRAKGLFWDKAWKLVEGCSKISPGCDNCWSEQETAMRMGHPNAKISDRAKVVGSFFNGNILLRIDNLDLPLRTKKPTVFAIWNDLWHEDVDLSFICDAYRIMERSRRLGHTFLVLTKRAERMGEFLGEVNEPVPDHVWHGITAENQQTADERIPHLLRVPGKRFLSIEPMLGPTILKPEWFKGECIEHCESIMQMSCNRQGLPCVARDDGIAQILLGGESGKHARPMHPDWARSVRDQCAAASVPYYFKQWGEFAPNCLCDTKKAHKGVPRPAPGKMGCMFRCGKKKAGRLLDGVLHDDLAWGDKP